MFLRIFLKVQFFLYLSREYLSRNGESPLLNSMIALDLNNYSIMDEYPKAFVQLGHLHFLCLKIFIKYLEPEIFKGL